MVRDYAIFLWRLYRYSFLGSMKYYLWMSVLTILSLVGLYAYAQQTVSGLAITDMTDQVSWGVYIANFTFIVGLAAAAVMLVIPAYIYNNKHLHDVVILGELLAIAAIVMCLLFVNVDLGQAGPVLAPQPNNRGIQLSRFHAFLGRNCSHRLPGAEYTYLRLPPVHALP